LVHNPSGPLKSGIPDSVEIPAPVKTRIREAGRSTATADPISFDELTTLVIIRSPDHYLNRGRRYRFGPGAYDAGMNRSEVQAWLDRYLDAWKRNEPELIETLFTDDAVYHYAPYPAAGVLEGNAAIVAGWGEHHDAPDEWEASYEVFAVDDDRAVAIGTTRYFAKGDQPEKLYHNCFLLRFAPDGRCSEFTEYYMLEKKA